MNVETVLPWFLDHSELLVALVVGLLSMAGHYHRTGRVPLGRIPFRELRKLWAELSSVYFRRDRPTGVPGLIVNMDAAALESQLRTLNFESGDLYSYEYEGEILNLRQPADFHPHARKNENIPSELHVRVFQLTDGRLLILAHHEASRFEAWGHHIRGTILSWSRGRLFLEQGFETMGIGYEHIESEEAADIEVIS